MKIIAATNNKGKLMEIEEITRNLDIVVRSHECTALVNTLSVAS